MPCPIMRILAIDYGSRRIGIAVSDSLGMIAQAVTVIHRSDDLDQDLSKLAEIIQQYESVEEIVVGLPKTMSGEIGISAQKVLEFVEILKAKFTQKITTWDERLTTAGVEKVLIEAGLSRQKRKKVIDKSAATYMLQGYLDSKRS